MTPHSPRPDSEARPIDEAAADWLARRVQGLSAGEAVEFARWRMADPRHAACFAELEATWQSLDALPEVRLPDGRAVDHDVAPAEPASARRRHPGRAWWIASTLAAAAALALGIFQRDRTASATITQTASTDTGGFEKLVLPDGTTVRLNTASSVDASFTRTERRVTLTRGEASFEVAKDPARPFVVQAGDVAVRAVGTAFNVRFRPDAIDVIVTEGSVRVDHAREGRSLLPATDTASPADRPVLQAGQRVTIKHATLTPTALVKIAADEIARELAWQERRLEFVDAPLDDVVAEFNRHNRHTLVIADQRLKTRRFGGSIRADNAEAFVRLLESRFGVKAEHQPTQTLLRVVE